MVEDCSQHGTYRRHCAHSARIEAIDISAVCQSGTRPNRIVAEQGSLSMEFSLGRTGNILGRIPFSLFPFKAE